MASCLATSPGFEEVTLSLRAYMEPVLRETVLNGTDVFKLDKGEVTRENVEYFGADKDLLFLMGHGSETILTGASMSEVVLDHDNVSLTNGKVVYALSCLTGAQLGQQAVDAGARAYIGFTKEYTLYMNSNTSPLEDPLAQSSIIPAMEIMRSLYAGKTVADAVADGKAAFQAEITRWQVIDSPVSSFVISALQWDYDVLTALGDVQATAATPKVSLSSAVKCVLFR
jgi:hypothetical protein